MMPYRTVALLVLTSVLWGCQTHPATEPVSEDTSYLVNRFENRLALKLFDDAFDELLSHDPEAQTQFGIHDQDGKWTPFSYQHSLEQVELMEAHLAKIGNSLDIERLNAQNRLSYELFRYNTLRRRQSLDFWWHRYPVNQMFGRHTGMPAFLINIHPGRNITDLENYIRRLEAMEEQLDTLIAVMKTQKEKGIVAPAFVYTHAIENCRNLIEGAPFDGAETPSPLLADFESKVRHLNLAPEVGEVLIEQARSALANHVGPGYRRLIEYLVDAGDGVTINAGVWKLPQGAAYYETNLEHYTTTGLTADEIHQLGLDEVARIHAEIRAIMKKVGFDGSLEDTVPSTQLTTPTSTLVSVSLFDGSSTN
ncbi:MAG: DUF885 domain-containing protein, partial [Pseudomonadales bacterium]|nr:DUF885 domain-containing protein [Pseudomonadales bacterium]